MIFLARHGETEDNRPPLRFMGSRDSPLTEKGRRQATALGRAAAELGLTSLFTSPQRRAIETAAVVARYVGLEPVVDARLEESSRGAWEGRLADDIARQEPERWAAWQQPDADFRFPGGESLGEHMARVQAAIEDLRAAPQPTLAVAHGGTIRCALINARGLRPQSFHELQVPYATIIVLEADGRAVHAAAGRGAR